MNNPSQASNAVAAEKPRTLPFSFSTVKKNGGNCLVATTLTIRSVRWLSKGKCGHSTPSPRTRTRRPSFATRARIWNT